MGQFSACLIPLRTSWSLMLPKVPTPGPHNRTLLFSFTSTYPGPSWVGTFSAVPVPHPLTLGSRAYNYFCASPHPPPPPQALSPCDYTVTISSQPPIMSTWALVSLSPRSHPLLLSSSFCATWNIHTDDPVLIQFPSLFLDSLVSD